MLDVENAVLCSQLCRSVTVTRRPSGHVMLDTPFCYPDGDRYPIYVTETQTGGFRLSDGGHTLMHFSYEHDIDKLLKGARRVLMDQAITQEGANYDESSGTFYVETSPDHLADGVFRLGQALTRVFSLSSPTRAHIAPTFYEDLQALLVSVASHSRLTPDYRVPDLPDAEHYPVDFRVETQGDPLFVYGIPNKDKARLATIVIQYLLHHKVKFDSLLVFSNQEEIPRPDLARLSNVGGEMISSLAAASDLRRKLERHLAA